MSAEITAHIPRLFDSRRGTVGVRVFGVRLWLSFGAVYSRDVLCSHVTPTKSLVAVRAIVRGVSGVCKGLSLLVLNHWRTPTHESSRAFSHDPLCQMLSRNLCATANQRCSQRNQASERGSHLSRDRDRLPCLHRPSQLSWAPLSILPRFHLLLIWLSCSPGSACLLVCLEISERHERNRSSRWIRMCEVDRSYVGSWLIKRGPVDTGPDFGEIVRSSFSVQ